MSSLIYARSRIREQVGTEGENQPMGEEPLAGHCSCDLKLSLTLLVLRVQ